MIYLDNAATTPLCVESADAMAPYFSPGYQARFGNANSLYGVGREAFSTLEDARRVIARSIGASRPDEVIFTSGATESDNAALVGLTEAALERRKMSGKRVENPMVIVSAIEHDAVLECAHHMARRGFDVVVLPVNGRGMVSPEALREALDARTILVSIMLANNEIGAIQPIRELSDIAHRAGALFHTDAVQALGKIDVNVGSLGVDAASFSAHKVHGPKGVGVLYLKSRTPFSPIIIGGGQESGRRSGTQNVCGAVGAAAAFRLAASRTAEQRKALMGLRDALYDGLRLIPEVFPTVAVERESAEYLPNIVNVCVRGFESQTLLLRLEQEGYLVSGGSACSSSSLDPSHVLTAIGVNRKLAQGELRVSLDFDSTLDDVRGFLGALESVIRRGA